MVKFWSALRSKSSWFLVIAICFLSFNAISGLWVANKPPVFRFHLLGEPMDLDPAHISGASGSYLLYNLYRSLFRYRPNIGLVPEGATHCNWQNPLRLTCYLDPQRKWSDGRQITATQYVHAFQRLVDPETRSVQTELLLSLKNAREILSGSKSPQTLGVRARSEHILTFELVAPDSDFEYRLASPALAPLHTSSIPDKARAHEVVVNGPYKVAEWGLRGRIRLEPNPHYPGAGKRPAVEVLLVDDDTTALRLYETGHLNLLRRLPSILIEKYRSRPDFFQVPLARFDYLGFGPHLRNQPQLRKSLTYALDYDKLKELYHALGRPGCPSIPVAYMMSPVCYPFQKEEARVLLENQEIPSLRHSIIGFSKMGGDDIQRGMEWLQGQWNQNLDWQFQLDGREQGMYLHQLRVTPAMVFRKECHSIDPPVWPHWRILLPIIERTTWATRTPPSMQRLTN